jgi:hypothetical protein
MRPSELYPFLEVSAMRPCLPLVVLLVLSGVPLVGLSLPQSAPADERGKQPKPKTTNGEALKDLAPKTITFRGGLPLTKALAELAKQTGNTVADRRREDKSDPEIKLDLQKATFWQALEDIARAADLRIALYQRDGQIALVDGPYHAVPVSFSGLFRTAVKRVIAVRDLESDAHFYLAQLEVAWEPRFQPFLIETRPDALVVEDDQGHGLKIPEDGKGQAPVSGKAAVEIEVRLPALKRSAAKLRLLKGSLALIGPSKLLTVTLDTLAKGEKKKQHGVTVAVEELNMEDDRWTVGIQLDYPEDGPKFESFQSWLVYNRIELESKKGDKPFPNNGGSETVSQEGNQAVVRYHFVETGRLKLGKPADWKLVYRTPGRIIEVPVAFEFKDVSLP